MKQKSILEQALLQVENLEEAVKQNAKGILASTMKQELNELLKESMEEEEEDSEKEPMPNEEEEKDMSEQPDDEEGDETDDEMPSINDEPSKDVDSEDEDEADSEEEDDEDSDEDEMSGMDDEMPGMDDDESSIDNEPSMGNEMPEFGDDESSMDNDDVLDMSNASEDEVAKVFKAMGPKDGIIVKKDGNNIELSDEDDEYIIKLGDEVDHLSEEEEEFKSEDDDETVYEIELGEEEEEEDSTSKEQEVGEAARTKSNVHGNKGPAPHGGLPSKKKYNAGSGSQKVNEELQTLKKQNTEYKKALLLFKEKINEVAVFNANLAYATRLFTEHSTTKKEKMNILKRFDTISSINESKNLYNTIKTELETKKPVTEAVVDKIQVGLKTTSSTEVLSESKVYEAPQFARMKDLMRKIK